MLLDSASLLCGTPARRQRRPLPQVGRLRPNSLLLVGPAAVADGGVAATSPADLHCLAADHLLGASAGTYFEACPAGRVLLLANLPAALRRHGVNDLGTVACAYEKSLLEPTACAARTAPTLAVIRRPGASAGPEDRPEQLLRALGGSAAQAAANETLGGEAPAAARRRSASGAPRCHSGRRPESAAWPYSLRATEVAYGRLPDAQLSSGCFGRSSSRRRCAQPRRGEPAPALPACHGRWYSSSARSLHVPRAWMTA